VSSIAEMRSPQPYRPGGPPCFRRSHVSWPAAGRRITIVVSHSSTHSTRAFSRCRF